MPSGLLEPRLYRAAFAPALLALIVLAFSLQDPPRAMSPELAPPTFNAQRAVTTAGQLVKNYGARESGSSEDNSTAELVQARLSAFGFGAASFKFNATTLNGERKLTNVVGVRPGPSDRRLLIVASRDGSSGSLRDANALETGVLLELARVLEGRAFQHTLVLASVTGGVDGGLGAEQFAKTLRRPVDGILVLRNVGGKPKGDPVLAEYNSREQSDPRFERTVERIATTELRRPVERRSVPAQLVRMAFPMALGQQATFPENGLTVAAISPGGEPLVPPIAKPNRQIAAVGQTALRTLTTLDDGFSPAAPEPTPLRVGGKLIPQWALILFIGSLFFPLIVAAIDAWARARRWHQVSTRGIAAPPVAFVWLLLIGLLMRAIGLTGVIDAPALPPEPAALSGALPIVVGITALTLSVLGVLVAGAAARQATARGGEAGFALWLAFAGVAVFLGNPIAAGAWLLLLHLLVLLLLAGGGSKRSQVWVFALIGFVPIALAAIYYPVVFGLSVLGTLRFSVLLETGGFVGILALAGGCAIVAAVGTSLLHLHWMAPRARKRSDFAPSPSPLHP